MSKAIHSEPLKLLNFDFNADPDPDFLSNADPDRDAASKINADLRESGSATLLVIDNFQCPPEKGYMTYGTVQISVADR